MHAECLPRVGSASGRTKRPARGTRHSAGGTMSEAVGWNAPSSITKQHAEFGLAELASRSPASPGTPAPSSPGELEMTFSTSEVAVCCSSASFSSRPSRATFCLSRASEAAPPRASAGFLRRRTRAVLSRRLFMASPDDRVARGHKQIDRRRSAGMIADFRSDRGPRHLTPSPLAHRAKERRAAGLHDAPDGAAAAAASGTACPRGRRRGNCAGSSRVRRRSGDGRAATSRRP